MEVENTTDQAQQVEETQDTGIVIHSLESDMKDLGIGVDEESIEDTVQPQKEVVVEEEPKKLSRRERRIKKQANENRELRERLAELESKQSEQPAKEDVGEIDIDDFESYDDYVKALDEQDKKASEPKQETETVLDFEAQQNMLEDGVEDYENFEELVMADDLALTENVLGLVLEADNASDIAYYLATHKDETRNIASMSPRQMAKAITKIEVKLENQPKQKVVRATKAPEPISPVSGQSVKGRSLNDDDLSFEQHEALLNAQTRSNAGGFI